MAASKRRRTGLGPGFGSEAVGMRSDRRFCQHCNQYLSIKSYRYHKRLYFDKEKQEWCAPEEPSAGSSCERERNESESPPGSPLLTIETAAVSRDSNEEPIDDSPPSFTTHACLTWGPNSSGDVETDSDTEPIDEVWNEEDEVIPDFKDPDEESPIELVGDLQPQEVQGQSRILAIWLLHFFFSLQSVFHMSDSALQYLIRFFKVFFVVLGRFCKIASEVAECLPSSLYLAKSSLRRPEFCKYVVCKKCHRIYFFSDCVQGPRFARTSKLCSYQQFPLHPQQRMRKECGAVLLKSVELATGRKCLYPRMTYCYLGLEVALRTLLMKPDFYTNCELWRSRKKKEGVMYDIYDGKVWTEFQSFDGHPFLSDPGNYAVMLNMDFFQPYKHVQYSVGAIYLTILNLPRGIRNKTDNVILIGLIPGPHEPRRDINPFLEPFVDELMSFWTGIELNVHSFTERKVIRSALLCVACDLPAGRKTCGFLSYNARFGCSRCWKAFSGRVGNMDYSGFDRENWRLRTAVEHRQLASTILSKATKSDRDAAESASGCRYSVLLKLPYFDAPRMMIIDPMHNLFLGSAKHFLKSILIDNSIINESQFDTLQARVDSSTSPPDIGRIPHKIRSGFASFTADQWKNWVFYFSLIVMRDILDSDVLECWRHFVRACRVLCRKQLTMGQVLLGDAHLLQFCKRTQRIFGNHVITPNMHMHSHLRSCIVDYGPLHDFWLFAFERYNGLLGAMPHNNRCIEIQIMDRFLRDTHVFGEILPEEFSEEFVSLLPTHMRYSCGSLAETVTLREPSCTLGWVIDSPGLDLELPASFARKVLDQTQKNMLTEMYASLYKVPTSSLTLSTVFQRYSSVKFNGILFGSTMTRTASSSIAIAVWDTSVFGSSSSTPDTSSPAIHRAVRINSFYRHTTIFDGESKIHMLVSLSWFKCHPKHSEIGKPVSVWYYDIFESFGIHSVVPVHFLQSKCVSLIDKLDEELVLFVCPCINNTLPSLRNAAQCRG